MASTKYFEIQLKGFKEAIAQLKEFGPNVARNGLRTATFAGAKTVRDAVAEQSKKLPLHVRSGYLSKNIVTFKRKTPEYEARYSVGIRKFTVKYTDNAKNRRLRRAKKTYKLETAYYGRYLEFGTSKMRAYSFMRPGFDGSAKEALDAMAARLGKAIIKAAAVANAKTKQ